MKAAIFNPYLNTLGGGERYCVSVAIVLANNGWKVDIEWKEPSIKRKIENRFGLDLTDLHFVDDIKRGDGYDLCFWLSDGSIPSLMSRKNFLHFQYPFQKVGGKSIFNKMKLFRINKVICNSYFTKKFVDLEYGIDSIVIYPPVLVEKIKPKKKENLILCVNRFSQLTQAKKQEVLIAAFKKLYDSGTKNWKLILAGGTDVGVDNFVDELRKQAQGYPIKIVENPSFVKLKDLYGKSKIFWTASGFGKNEEVEPIKVEHFGMVVAEAMAGGAVPFAYSAGGHKEIINHKINGFLWNSIDELQNITKMIINKPSLLKRVSLQAIKDSNKFSLKRFEKEFLQQL